MRAPPARSVHRRFSRRLRFWLMTADARVENDLGRPVVAFELDDRDFRKVVLEIENVAEVGAAPLVDRLIRIADDREVAVHLRQAPDQQVLRPVRVLVLVDHDEPELSRVFRANLRRLFEQLDRLQQQIVEIEGAALLERIEIVRVDLGDLLVLAVPAAGIGHGLGTLHAVLRVADARQRRPGLHVAVVDVQILERLFDDRQLIGRVVDDEVAREADGGRLAPEQARAERVERRHPHAAAVGSSSASTRARISSAALLVNVTASTSSGRAWPSPTRYAILLAMTRVFPDPAPARISSGPLM